MIKRRWLLIPLLIVAAALIWLFNTDNDEVRPLQTAIGLKSASVERAKGKPICASPVNPNVAAPTDCIPAYVAALPPDPGPEDLKRIEGADVNKNGIWDGPERWVVLNYGHSAVAVQTLFAVVKAKQLAVMTGDSLPPEEAQKLMPVFMNAGVCYARTATPEMLKGRALQLAEIEVANTPARFTRAAAFNYALAHNVYMVTEQTVAEACGFDPSTLPN